jgi:hypothetical protein
MGLTTETKSVQQFGDQISLRGGQFTLAVEEGTEDAIERKITSGKREGEIVHELKYPTVYGMLMDVGLEDAPRGGKQGSIALKDFKTDETFNISVFGDSGMFTDFIKHLPNIDTSKQVWLQMEPKKGGAVDSNGNPLTNLKVLQDCEDGKKGNLVPDYYSEYDHEKDNPRTGKKGAYVTLHDMPEWEHNAKGWNHDDQDFYLWEKLEEFIESYVPPTTDPSFGDAPSGPAGHTSNDTPAPKGDIEDEDEDSMPF